jgi:hypothetical protein
MTSGGAGWTRASTRVVVFTEIPTWPGLGSRTVQPTQTSGSKMSDDGRMQMIRFRDDESGAPSTLLGFRRVTQPVCIGLAIACLLVGCVKRLPPAPTPQAVAPVIPAAPPPPPGYTRLVVDVVDGPAAVQQVRMQSRPVENDLGRISYQFSERPEVLCTAPCATDLPAGNILLGFPVLGKDALETELVHLGPEPSVYRRALSIYDDRSGGLRVFGIIATAVGGASAITGTALLPIGLSDGNGALTAAGGITLGVGAALIAFGVWAIRHDAPTFRPGSSNHFPLAPASP